MSDQFDTSPIASALQNSQEICIALSHQPNLDAVAAGLSLYLSFIAAGKKTTITCPSPMVVEFSRLVGLDKISKQFGNRNLIVSFDYQKDSIEKVSYHVVEDKFNLVVHPKKGAQPLDFSTVKYSYQGLLADVIFIIGAEKPTDLGELYLENKSEFAKAYTISLNRTLATHFAKTSITDPHASSLCEITAWLLEQLGFMPKGDIAGNLLSGMDSQTQRFSSDNTPASAFSLAGRLIQNGAVRQTEIIRPTTPNLPQHLLSPMPASLSATLSPDNNQPASAGGNPPDPQSPAQAANGGKNPPKDWLEPKIFQGSTKI